MILVDTSVWIDHLKKPNEKLISLLKDNYVLSHPFILGEVYIGHLKNRDLVLELMGTLPIAKMITHEELIGLIKNHKLWGKGLGWIDLHLLGSALLSKGEILTYDKKLMAIWNSMSKKM